MNPTLEELRDDLARAVADANARIVHAQVVLTAAQEGMTEARHIAAIAIAAMEAHDRAVAAMGAVADPIPAADASAAAARQRHDVQGAVMGVFAQSTHGKLTEGAIVGLVDLPTPSVHDFLLRAVRGGKLVREGDFYRLPDAVAEPTSADEAVERSEGSQGSTDQREVVEADVGPSRGGASPGTLPEPAEIADLAPKSPEANLQAVDGAGSASEIDAGQSAPAAAHASGPVSGDEQRANPVHAGEAGGSPAPDLSPRDILGILDDTPQSIADIAKRFGSTVPRLLSDLAKPPGEAVYTVRGWVRKPVENAPSDADPFADAAQ